MSYEKQTWSTGDTITAEKLNHIEGGIEAASSGGGGGGICIIHAEVDTRQKTASITESADVIVSAIKSGKIVIAFDQYGSAYFESYYEFDSLDDVESLTCYFNQLQIFSERGGFSNGQIQVYWESDDVFDVSYNTEGFSLPAFTAADAGKVLAVKSNGLLEWKSL